MKQLLILAFVVAFSVDARSQETVFKDDFSDTTFWVLSTSDSVEAGIARALFENQKLVLMASQGFVDCTTASAFLRKKADINPEDHLLVTFYIDSFDISGSYDFNINLGLASKRIKLIIDQVYLPEIKKPVIQFDISDSVAVSLLSGLNPDSVYTEANAVLNNPSHKQVFVTEDSDSIDIQLEANACAPDLGALTKVVMDSIAVTKVILNSGLPLSINKNMPVIKSYNGNYYIDLKETATFRIEIIDVTGRTIFNRKFNSDRFDLGFLPDGFYLVHLAGETGQYTSKISITKQE